MMVNNEWLMTVNYGECCLIVVNDAYLSSAEEGAIKGACQGYPEFPDIFSIQWRAGWSYLGFP